MQTTRVILQRRLVALMAIAGVRLFAAAAGADELTGSAAWRHDSVWDDGNAEFCAYEIDWDRYGRSNPGTALLVAVKEPWAPDLDVKADRVRADGFEVLKLNHIRDVATGIYAYHQMASTFIRRDDGALQKLAVTSSEGCGISTAQMTDWRLSTRSYFDGQGESTGEYPRGAMAADGLALTLREYVTGEIPGGVAVFPSLMTGRFPKLDDSMYSLQRREAVHRVPAGEFDSIELELTALVDQGGGPAWMRFAFSSDAPHPLVYYEDSGGTVYRLAKCERISYWRMNDPEGGSWLPQASR